MMKCLVVVANPKPTSFSMSVADKFKEGLTTSGHEHKTINLFQEGYPIDRDHPIVDKFQNDQYRSLISTCDGMAFVFPVWCEMPPYPLVAFFQTIFVEGFAYKHDGVKTPILNIPVQLLISMGQDKAHDIKYLTDAMRYCGLHSSNELVFKNVGPRQDPTVAEMCMSQAYKAGQSFFTK